MKEAGEEKRLWGFQGRERQNVWEGKRVCTAEVLMGLLLVLVISTFFLYVNLKAAFKEQNFNKAK